MKTRGEEKSEPLIGSGTGLPSKLLLEGGERYGWTFTPCKEET